MEAVLAAPEPSRIHSLIDRILSFPARSDPPAVFDIAKPDFAAVRAMTEASLPNGEDQDEDWLRRSELRSTGAVATMLESIGFAGRRGETEAIFVDARCGLIGSQAIGKLIATDTDAIVSRILRAASGCDARGIILATQCSAARVRGPYWRQIIRKLRSKGEAIDIVLLDHVVLTASGWNRLFVGAGAWSFS